MEQHSLMDMTAAFLRKPHILETFILEIIFFFFLDEGGGGEKGGKKREEKSLVSNSHLVIFS